ncbi:MAG TPA: hypothetical protein PLV87_01500 [Opitutaceae bacterium]|nr:hypothetical protein [Opitutaceae bacterium]
MSNCRKMIASNCDAARLISDGEAAPEDLDFAEVCEDRVLAVSRILFPMLEPMEETAETFMMKGDAKTVS